MKNRRQFLKTSLAVALGAGVASRLASAEETKAAAASAAAFTGVIYTKENAGKWAKKVGSHLPIVTVEAGKVKIETDHGMSMKHFIVRHTLVAENGDVLGEKTFAPTDEEAISEFTLPEGAKGKFYATSFCNKHDFWLTPFEV